MRIGVPSETAPDETRVALTPTVAGQLVDQDHDVCIGPGAGVNANWHDEAYRDVGCSVVEDRSEVFDRSDVILQVRGLGANPNAPADPYHRNQVVIGLLGPYDIDEELANLAERNVSAFALELVPRISRAQSMDVLSSMATIAGYKTVVMAADAVPKLFPLMMTAAGTIQPAEVFVVGAGVAGLQAIATAERLGAAVQAYDIRPEVKEEVESLGAEFVELDLETDDAADDEGYGQRMDDEFYRKQRKMMTRVVADADVVITTAAVPGEPAPELVTSAMIGGMEPGSVVVDLAADGGGNCEPTRAGETVTHEGVTVFGPTNLPTALPQQASTFYANNVMDFLENLIEEGEIVIDTDDEIVDATLITHDGSIRSPHEDDE